MYIQKVQYLSPKRFRDKILRICRALVLQSYPSFPNLNGGVGSSKGGDDVLAAATGGGAVSVPSDSDDSERLPFQRGDGVQPGGVVGVEDVSDEAAVDDGPEDVDGVAAAEEAVHSPIVAVFVCCHRSLILLSYTALVRQPLVYLRARAPLRVR